ncbi:MAG: recombinase RecA [Clostridia bacterium]|nr:recombinase RecA [Clostridia bacterium]MBQ8235496.1 recombinase RecA [Clostridia bacterium]MBQ8400164.1 recombinase RecA [Clostridia bacterium]
MAAKTKKAAVEQVSDKENRDKALKTAISQIEKKFGAGTIMKLGDNNKMEVSAVSTGSLTLDMALGVGGLPKGRIIEIYGPESSGKTTVALHAVAEVQKNGGVAAFVDAEHALDPKYAQALGVNIEEMLVSQPDSGEQALDVAEALVRSGAVDIVVVDSVAALVPQAEIDGDMGASHVGLHARLMSQALRKLSGAIAKSNCIVIFINQLREKVGVMYGNPEVTTGGRALKFYASVRIEVRRSENLKNGTEVYGSRTKCKVVKNKVAPPFKVAEFDIIYGKGISKTTEIIDLAMEMGIVERSGAWFYYEGTRIGQGKEAAKKYIEDNPELMKELEEKLKNMKDDIDIKEEPGMLLDDEDGEEGDYDISLLGLSDD